MRLRHAFSLYLHGEGIEIGALHQPLSLEGLPITRIRYVDRLTVEQLRAHYPELSNYKFAPVDVLDDGEKLSLFADASLDFVIANHFIEHARNPIGTLRAWLCKLRPNGVIYLAIPDKRLIFDALRPLTTLDHLVDDDKLPESDQGVRDHKHYLEYAQLVNKIPPAELEEHVTHLHRVGYSIHFHTFVPSSFHEMLQYSRDKLALPFNILAYASAVPRSDEFLAVLSKRA
jgi:SAM-dependent methyltransferase